MIPDPEEDQWQKLTANLQEISCCRTDIMLFYVENPILWNFMILYQGADLPYKLLCWYKQIHI